jgi:hypothetical protein
VHGVAVPCIGNPTDAVLSNSKELEGQEKLSLSDEKVFHIISSAEGYAACRRVKWGMKGGKH